MAVGAVAAAAMVVGVVAAGMAEAVDTMGLPMAAGPTWVMGGVGTDLLVTP